MLARDPAVLAAVQRGHVRTAKVTLHDWQAGATYALPIAEGGSVTFSWGDDGKVRRAGTINVPGYQWEQMFTTTAYVKIEVAIDDTHLFDLGQFPVAAVSTPRPGGAVEVTLGDWALRAERALHRTDSVQGPFSLAAHVQSLLNAPTPWAAPVTVNDATGGTTPFTLNLVRGKSFWETAAGVCSRFGCTPVFRSSTSIEIRNYELDTVPVESIPDLVLIDRHTGVDTTSGFVNRVVVTIEDDPGGTRYTADRRILTGPFKWAAAGIGWADHVPDVEKVAGATQAVADAKADKIFSELGGLAREVPLTIIPMPWLEPGDLVEFPKSPTGEVERFLLRSVTVPLSPDGAMEITTRDRTVWPDGGM